MPILMVNMIILGEIFFGLLAYLFRPAENILVLYLHQDLLLKGIQWCEVFIAMTGASGLMTWAPRMAMGSKFVTLPLGLRDRKVTLSRVPILPLLFFF